MINEVVGGVKGIKLAVHLCRGPADGPAASIRMAAAMGRSFPT